MSTKTLFRELPKAEILTWRNKGRFYEAKYGKTEGKKQLAKELYNTFGHSIDKKNVNWNELVEMIMNYKD